MKAFLYSVLFALSVCPAKAEAPVLFLQGTTRQGDMPFVFATPKSKITVNGMEITPRDDGWFVFGIGRDETGSITLTAEKDGQKTVKTFKIEPRKWNVQRVDGVPDNTVNPTPEEQARIEKEAVAAYEARQKKTDMPLSLCFQMPVKGRISSVYGSQRIMNGVVKNAHNALDIAKKEGEPIYAAADGVVLLAYDEMFLGGKVVLIGHGQDVSTSSLHLSKLSVKTGDKVKKGDEIGRMGMTGRATGPHLHWAVLWKNTRVDPQAFLKTSAKFCNTQSDSEK